MSDIDIQQTKEATPEIQKQPAVLRFFAHLISYMFHPVFMPTFMTLVLFTLAPVGFAGLTSKQKTTLIIPIIINTLFFPLLGALLTKGVGFIESIHMKTTKDRIIPLLISMIFYFWAYHVYKNAEMFHAPEILLVLLLGSFWGVIAVFMCNIFVKISMHTAAAGSMIGIMMVLMFNSPVNLVLPFFLILIIAGLIGTARLILGTHTRAEIWLGYIVGILAQVGAYWYL